MPRSSSWPRPSGSRASAAPSWVRRCGRLLGFFNGIGRPRVTLWITLVTTVANALLNQVFIFGLGLGHRRLRLGDQRRAADRAAVRARHLSAALLPAGVPLAPDLAAACAAPARAVAPRRADGAVAGGRPARLCDLPDDADAARDRRRGGHADGRDADLARLHARFRHRLRRHHAGRPVDRRRCARLGACASATASSCWRRSTWAASVSLIALARSLAAALLHRRA